MIIETKLEFKKYLKMTFYMTYRKPIIIFISITALIMFFISLLYFLGIDIPFNSPPYIQLLFGFSIIIVFPFSIYKGVKKNFSSHARLHETIFYEFTDDKIKIRGETFNSELEWNKTYKIIESKDWIFIYQNRQIANILPKESFGEKIIEFRALIKKLNLKSNLQ